MIRSLTTVFTVMRRKLKKEEMEKQFDPNTLERRMGMMRKRRTKTSMRTERMIRTRMGMRTKRRTNTRMRTLVGEG